LDKIRTAPKTLTGNPQERLSIATATYFGYFSIKLFFGLTTVMIDHQWILLV
jgi:hypothetical protein